MAYKLVVSTVLEFPVRFSLLDGEKDRLFTFKVRGNRVDVEAFRKTLGDSTDMLVDALRKFLLGDQLGLKMVDWVGPAALVDDAGQPAPAGPEALAALLQLDGMTQHVFNTVAEANSAKGRLGN